MSPLTPTSYITPVQIGRQESLDEKLREHLQPEIKRIQQELSVTMMSP